MLAQKQAGDTDALILYYDASLSVIVRDSNVANGTQNTIPYRRFTSTNPNKYLLDNTSDSTNIAFTGAVYLIIVSGAGDSGASNGKYYKAQTRMTITAGQGKTLLGDGRANADSSKGTWLYQFIVDKNIVTADTEIVFSTGR